MAHGGQIVLSEETFRMVECPKARKLPAFTLPGREETVVGYLISDKPAARRRKAKV